MKRVDSRDRKNIVPNRFSVPPLEIQRIGGLEWDWIDRILDQVILANTILTRFQLRLLVRRFCDCWPNCYFHKEENS